MVTADQAPHKVQLTSDQFPQVWVHVDGAGQELAQISHIQQRLVVRQE